MCNSTLHKSFALKYGQVTKFNLPVTFFTSVDITCWMLVKLRFFASSGRKTNQYALACGFFSHQGLKKNTTLKQEFLQAIEYIT